jgi:hypothetical protein
VGSPGSRVVTLADDRERVEHRIGRALSAAERAIDVLGIDATLNREKAALERAVEAEKRRAVRQIVGGLAPRRVRLRVTEQMRDPLRRLHVFGLREARAELSRLGYKATARALASHAHDDELRDIFDELDDLVDALTVRVRAEAVEATLGDVVAEELSRALLRIPGARSIAAELVSSAFTSGLGATFEENESLIGGWEYTSVLDGARCSPCRSKHGTTYETWADVQEDLPGGGPNPECRGSGRCRCRAVPLPA